MIKKKKGLLFWCTQQQRYGIQYDDGEVNYGLHCGAALEVFSDGRWVQTHVTYDDEWYLTGIGPMRDGMFVRVSDPCLY